MKLARPLHTADTLIVKGTFALQSQWQISEAIKKALISHSGLY
jgi:hypothetical protein